MVPATLSKLAVPVDSLKPYAANPRQGSVEHIKDSLRHHGQYRPIVVRKVTNEVLAGNHTLMAARELGWTEIAATFIECDDDEAARIVLVDNRSNDLASYDNSLLADLLSSLPDLDGTGYGQEDLAALLATTQGPGEGLSDPDEVPEPPAEPVTKPGDLWLLGEHRLLCGDCRDLASVERLLDGRKANLVVTSPPYASQRKYDPSSGFKPIPPDEYGDWFAEVASVVWAALADNGSFLLNIKEHCDDGERHLYVKKLVIRLREEMGWRFVDEFCWVDTRNGVPGSWPNRYKDAWEPVFHFAKQGKIKFHPKANGQESEDVFDYSSANSKASTGSGLLGSEKATPYRQGIAQTSNVLRIPSTTEGGHSAPYPVDLPAWFMRSVTDQGDVVLDPFAGSGTSIIAAHRERRIGYGLEISPTYCDVIARRFQEFTGIQPILEATGEAHDFAEDNG